MSCNNHSLQQENDKLREIIEYYQDYLSFLNSANEAPISLAYVHGYRFPEEICEQGVKYRNTIKQLEDEFFGR